MDGEITPRPKPMTPYEALDRLVEVIEWEGLEHNERCGCDFCEAFASAKAALLNESSLLAAKDDEILKLRAYAVALEGFVWIGKLDQIRDRLGVDWLAIQTDPRVQALIDSTAALSEPKT